jgi:hypothetical protein
MLLPPQQTLGSALHIVFEQLLPLGAVIIVAVDQEPSNLLSSLNMLGWIRL